MEKHEQGVQAGDVRAHDAAVATVAEHTQELGLTKPEAEQILIPV